MFENKRPVAGQAVNGMRTTSGSGDSSMIAGGYLIDVHTGRCILVSRRTALRIARFLDTTARERTASERRR